MGDRINKLNLPYLRHLDQTRSYSEQKVIILKENDKNGEEKDLLLILIVLVLDPKENKRTMDKEGRKKEKSHHLAFYW